MIGIAIVISRGLAKTGLGNRIGYYFISLFGRKTIGIGYALAALLPGLVCIALVPLVVYAVYPPEIKSTPDASTTAHITAMFAAFYVAGLALGTPPLYLGLLLAGASSLMMSLTHYVTGTSPIVFGSGYVSMENWWVMGLIMSIVNLLVWGVAGGLWWKVLGYW